MVAETPRASSAYVLAAGCWRAVFIGGLGDDKSDEGDESSAWNTMIVNSHSQPMLARIVKIVGGELVPIGNGRLGWRA